MKPLITSRVLLVTLVTSTALLGSARAATWTGGGTDDKWSTAANWGGAAPFNGESLVFAVTNRLGGSNDLVGYTFQDITLNTNGFTLKGAPFTLYNGIVNLNSAGTSNNIISNHITLAAYQTFASRIANTTLTLSGNITNGGNTLDHQGPGNWTYNGVISGDGGVTFTGSGANPANVTYANSNSYAGDTYVNGGANNGGRIALTTANSRIGRGTLYLTTDGTSPIGQGGQLYIQAGLLTNEIVMAGIGCSESAGHLGAIRLQTGSVSNITLTGNSRIMAYSGSSGTVFGTITSQYGTPNNLEVNVNDIGKTAGTGTVTFNKDNSALGTITIGAGTLVLKTAGGLGGSPLVIMSNATLNVFTATNLTTPALVLPSFIGSGAIQGSVAFASGSVVTLGTAPATATSLFVTGTNTTLTLNDAVTLNLDFSTNAAALGGGTNDLILCTNLTVNGTITVNPNFIGLTSPELNKPYTIIKYSGAYSGSGSFVLATGYGYTTSTSGGAVTVTFTALTPRNLTWDGSPAGDWDVNLTPDWKLTPGGTPTKFYSRDNVTFDDNGLSYSTINLPASLTPGTITFNNNGDYYLGTGYSGPGALLGASPLLKTGAGNLTINTTNTAYAGTITVNQGTLIVGNVSALGTTNGLTIVTNDGTLDVRAFNLGAEMVTVSGAGVNGKGAIVNNGAGQQQNALRYVTMSGDTTVGGSQRWDIRGAPNSTFLSSGGQPFNLTVAMDTSVIPNPSFSLVGVTVDPALGNIDVQSGIFSFETTSTTLGNPASSLVIEPGATFQLYQTTNFVNKVITFRDTSTFYNNNAGNTIIGPITLESGTIYGNGGGTYLRLFGPVTGSGALLKYGGGGLYFNGTNSSTGGLTVTNGAVGGGGYITGSPVIVTNATVSPGTNGVSTPGTFTVTSGLVLLTNSALTFDFTNNTAVGGGNDLISLSDGTTAGTLTLDGPITVNANPMAGNLVAGTYTLITNGSATLIPNAASIVPGNGLPIGARYGSPSFDLSTPGTLLMTIPTTGDKLVWKGLYAANWDTDAFSYSWSNAVTHVDPDYFYNSDSVVFDDSASSYAVTVNAPVLPNSLVLANNVNGYAFTSTVLATNRISGGTGLLQTGNGVNVMALNNDYTGGTVIQAGVLQLGHANALGNPQGVTPLAVITNRTAAGATLDINGYDLTGKTPPIFLSGPGTAPNVGALISSASGGGTSGNGVRSLTLTGNASIGQDGGNRMDVRSGVLNGGGFKLTKVGNNYSSLQGGLLVTNLAELDVNAGTIEAQVNVGPLVVVNPGGTFENWNFAGFTNAFVVNNGRLFNGSGTFVSYGPMTLNAGSNTFDGVMIISNKISGPGLLSKLGANALTLAADNDWTGGLLLPTGTLNIGAGTNAGTAGSGAITNNGVLNFNRTTALTWNNDVRGSGTWLKLNTNTMTVNSTNVTSSGANPVINVVGTLIIGPTGVLSATNTATQFYTGNATNGAIVVNGGTVIGGGYMQVGRSAGGNGSLTVNSGTVVHGTGSFLIAGDSGATGTITVNGGVISNTSVLYVGDTAAGQGYLNLNGGRVQAPQISYRNAPVTASVATFNGGIVEATASQANFLVISNAYISTNGLVFDTGATNVVTIAQNLLAFTNLPASAPNAGLVKLGASSLTLTGTNCTYPGNTLISNGTLVVNTRLAGGAMVVSPGGTLSGFFTNIAPLTVNGALAAGGLTPSAGTITVSNTVFGPGSTNLVDLAGPDTTPGAGINDLLVVNGNLDISNPSKVAFNFLNGTPAFGTPYTFITYSGTLSGTTANLQPVVTTPYVTASITNTANAIIVTFAISTPRGTTNLVWTGDGVTNVWAVATNGDWLTTPGGTPDVFYTMDNVLFDDSSANRTVNLAGVVAPAATVVNTATSYTFTNTGSLSGSGQLIKQGSGTLLLASTNSYGGGTLVSGGVVKVGVASTVLGRPSGATPLCVVTNAGGMAGAALDLNGVILSSVTAYTNPIVISGRSSTNAGAIYNSGTALGGSQGISSLVLAADATIGNSGNRFDVTSWVNGGGKNLTVLPGSGSYIAFTAGPVTNLNSIVAAGLGATEFQKTVSNLGGAPVTNLMRVNLYQVAGYATAYGGIVSNSTMYMSNAMFSLTASNGVWGGPIVLFPGTTNTFDDGNQVGFGVSGPISGAGALKKQNAQSLRLSGANTYSGNTLVTAGRLTFAAGSTLPSSPMFFVSSGTVLDVLASGTLALNSGQTLAGSGMVGGQVSVNSGGGVSPGTGLGNASTLLLSNAQPFTLNAGSTLSFDLSSDTTTGAGVSDLIAMTGGALNLNGGTVYFNPLTNSLLSGGTYTLINGGLAGSGSAANLTLTSPLPLNLLRQTFTLDSTTYPGSLALSVTGGTGLGGTAGPLVWLGNNGPNWNVKSTVNWFNNATATADVFYMLDGVQFDDTGVGTVTLNGSLFPVSMLVSNSIVPYTWGGSGTITGAVSLVKAGSGQLTLNTPLGNSAPTVVREGTVSIGVANALPNQLVQLGDSLSLYGGGLSLNSASQTIPGLNVNSTSAAIANLITIGGGQSLTVTGDINIGPATASATTVLNVSGAGSFVVNAPNNTLVLAKAGTGVNTGVGSTFDLSGLANLSLNLQNLNIGGWDNVAAYKSTMLLATNSSLKVTNLTVGSSNEGSSMSLLLGNGANIFLVDTFNVGTGGRDYGTVKFQTASGTVAITNTTGTGRANLNIDAINTGTTGYIATNVFDVSGHLANLYLGTLTMGDQSGRAGYQTNYFAFDQGTLDVTNVIMARRVGANKNSYSGMSLGGGTVNIGSGGLLLASNATGYLTISGGLVTLGGDITKGAASSGANLGTLTLAGGTLDMQSNKIGGAIPIDVLNFQAGTLQNAGEINAGASLIKTTPGTLVLAGNNTYTGATLVSDGTLFVNGIIGGSAVNDAAGTLGGTGRITAPVTIASGATLSPGVSVGTLTISNTLTLADGSTTAIEIDKTAGSYDRVVGLSSVTYAGTLAITNLTAPLASGDSFKLFTAAAYAGSFSSIIPATPGAGLVWDTSSLAVNGTLKVISVGGPQISTVFMSGANFVFSGSNGVPNATYNVLASTNVVTPLSQWIQVGTSTFGPDGSFSYTNIGSALEAQFFMLKVP